MAPALPVVIEDRGKASPPRLERELVRAGYPATVRRPDRMGGLVIVAKDPLHRGLVRVFSLGYIAALSHE